MIKTIGGIAVGVGAFGLLGFFTDQAVSQIESAPALIQRLNPNVTDYFPCFQCFVTDSLNSALQTDLDNRIIVTDQTIALYSLAILLFGLLLIFFG